MGPVNGWAFPNIPVSSPVLRVETVTKPPLSKRGSTLAPPANDNGKAGGLAAKVLIPRDLPITQTEIEVFALLLDDLVCLAANDNKGQPE